MRMQLSTCADYRNQKRNTSAVIDTATQNTDRHIPNVGRELRYTRAGSPLGPKIRRLLLGAALSFVGAISAFTSQAYAGTLARYGLWEVFRSDSGTCGAVTHMENGASLSLMAIDGEIHLAASDPSWTLYRSGSSVPVLLDVDGRLLQASAAILNARTIAVSNLTLDAVRTLMNGDRMLASFGGVRWNIDLNGSSDAVAGMAACALVMARY